MEMKENMDKRKILFVCLGNICRSPAAEGVMKKLLEERAGGTDIVVDSAGIGPWHAGQLPDSRMRRCGARLGYRFDSIARQVGHEDFTRFDIIVAMDGDNVKALRALARSEAERRKIVCLSDFFIENRHCATVPDPYYGPDSDFKTALTLIEDGCRGLLEEIS